MRKMSNLCTPALIYFIIASILLIINGFTNFNMYIILNVIIVVLWSLFLNYLCSIGYSTISWVLIVLPFLSFFLFFYLSSLGTK